MPASHYHPSESILTPPPAACCITPCSHHRDDYKEGQRKQLADSIVQYALNWNQARPRGPAIIVSNLQQQINFYDMSEEQRRSWLDDGLHFTAAGYDRLGQRIADTITKAVKASRR
jgi:lysophospholipase L1-like esterase